MTDCSRFTITAALPYANGPVHIGPFALGSAACLADPSGRSARCHCFSANGHS